MQGIASCPDHATLQRFLLGACAAAEAETLEAHLQQCDACGAALNALHARDTMVDVIRAQRGRAVQSPSEAVQHLAERIKGLRASAGAHDQSEASAPATVPPNETDAHAGSISDGDTAAIYDFLAPAVAAGELGCLGHYRVRKVLGTGGMGVVFLAYDPQLDRLVALKAMLPTMAVSASARRRFLREARAAAAIKHDHIVTIYQVGEDRGAPFLAMELLEGESLHDRLGRDRRLSPADTLRIGREIALALAAAHSRGLIHRDIKPGNIWLESVASSLTTDHGPRTTDDRVKILDFGLARATTDDAQLTQTGAIMGTPAFMAPEQLHGHAVDARCDLFSLGCVLYCMATGEQPFKGADNIATLMAITTQAPRPPQEIDPTLLPALCDLILRLLAKEPADRPPSAQAVVEAIGAIERGAQPSGLAALPKRRPAALASRRRRWPLVAAAVFAATLTAMVGLAGYLCGPTISRWVTNEGEVVIAIDDEHVQAVIDQTSLIIRDRAKKREYRIKPGRQTLPAGDWLLEVTEVDGDMRLFTREFTITRAGNATVRVTFDPKLLTAKTVAGRGKTPTELYADPAHRLVDVVDFRDIAGATAKEFNDWQANLGDGFRLAFISTRKGQGPTLFNAVAVREKTPRLVRCFTEPVRDEAERIWRRLVDDNDYDALALCRSQAGDGRSPWARTLLFIQDDVSWASWHGSLPFVTDRIAKEKANRRRPIYLEVFSGQDGPIYESVLAADQGRAWKPYYVLAADDLITTVRSNEEKGWRPDVIAPDWDGRHLRFMLVAVDNRDGPDWRLRVDMRLAQYKEESAKQRSAGLLPLALTSYGDGTDVRYAAIWVRYRAQGAAAPRPAAPDPRQADRASAAVSWTASVPGGVFADRAHLTADVLDWRDLAGADLAELRAWAAGLGPDFHVAWVSSRRGSGPGLFNAVALREKNPLPYRLFTGLTADEAAEIYKQQADEGYRPVQTCVSPQPDRPGAWLDTVLCVKDGMTPYNWGSNWASCREQIDKWAKENNRPAYLFGPPGPDVALYRLIMPGDEGRRWHGQYSIAADELVPTVEHYRRKGWRPDVLAPHWKENQLRFMLVAVDNADQVDWRFRMAMTLEQYRRESIEQKRRGLFPLTVVSYGDDAEVRYAAIWVRHRLPDAGK